MAAKKSGKNGKRAAKKRLASIFALVLIAALLITTLLSMMLTSASAETTDEDSSLLWEDGTILDNVSIGPVDVGGMTREEAAAAIASYVQEVNQGTTTLQGDLSSVEVSNADLGLSVDSDTAVEAALTVGTAGNLIERYKEIKTAQNEGISVDASIDVDEEAAEAVLLAHESELEAEAVDYELTLVNGEFVISGGSVGSEIDIEASIEAIKDFYSYNYSENGTVELVTVVTQPEGSEEELARVQDVLGTYTTTYTSGSNRGKNIELAASNINGTVLYPGESLSASDAMGERTAANGYLTAGAYENGTTVDSLGGGVCQVSSTLYNAVLNAELQVDTRYPHSMTVSYVSPSRDAAIASGSKDLVFTNDTDAPIYIYASAGGGYLTFTIYGEETRASNRTISFESVTTSTTESTVVYQEDSSLAFGTITKIQSGHTGLTAQLWKVIYIDGVETERVQVNSSTYKMTKTIYSVGTSTTNSTAAAELRAAIATNDLSTIQAVIAAGDGEETTESTDSAEETTESTDSTESTTDNTSDNTSEDTSESTTETTDTAAADTAE